MNNKELEIEVNGRVQGVAFRNTVRRYCEKNGINGFVVNKDDGNVLILVQAEKKVLENFLGWINGSPGFSYIESLRYNWRTGVKKYDDFKIIRKDNLIVEQAKNFFNLGKYLVGRGKLKVPTHLAIIPDGNRRWAKQKGLHAEFGHYRAANVSNVKSLIGEARNLGVKYISFWGFSTENWKRNDKEIEAIFDTVLNLVKGFRKNESENKFRFIHIGRKDRLPKALKDELTFIEEESKDNKDFTIVLFLDYGGRDEIARAINKIIKSGKKKIEEKDIENYLDTKGIPDPDFIIRTSGEQRLSGFMPFQAIYAELYFTDVLFPDFDAKELRKAVEEYSRRKRRFGGN